MSQHSARTQAWKRIRAVVLASSDICAICGRQVDPSAPPKSRWSPSVDHIVPASQGGDPLDPGNLRVAHYGCNSARGAGRIADPPRRSRNW